MIYLHDILMISPLKPIKSFKSHYIIKFVYIYIYISKRSHSIPIQFQFINSHCILNQFHEIPRKSLAHSHAAPPGALPPLQHFTWLASLGPVRPLTLKETLQAGLVELGCVGVFNGITVDGPAKSKSPVDRWSTSQINDRVSTCFNHPFGGFPDFAGPSTVSKGISRGFNHQQIGYWDLRVTLYREYQTGQLEIPKLN